jgi:hypothetical protein
MIETSKKLSIRVLALLTLAAAGCSVSAGGQIPCADDSSCPNDYPVCSSSKCVAGTSSGQNSVAVVGPEGHAAADFLSGTVRVIVSAKAASGVQSLKLAAGSTQFTLAAAAATPPLYAFDVNTGTLPDGDASLTATLSAGDGSSATATGTLHVDNAVPSITSFTAAGGASTTITSGTTAILQASFTASAGATGTVLAGGGSASISNGGSVLVSPDVATTYKLRVTSRSGITAETGSLAHPDVTVSVVGPVSFSSGSFTVSPSSIQQGATGNFTFTAPNFGSSTVSALVKDGSGAIVGTITTPAIPATVVIPPTTTSPAQLVYTLVLSNAASVPDVLSLPVVVSVVPATVAVVTSFDAATTHGTAGDSVSFSISTTGVTGNASVAVACLPTGTVPLSPFTITIGADGKGNANSTLPVNVTSGTSVCTYTATVQNSTGASVTAKTDVTVEPLPTIGPLTFASSGTSAATFAPGSLVTLNHTYNAQGGTATINGVAAGASSTSFNNIQASTVYTLTVTNLAGKQVSSLPSATATVSAQINSFSAGATLPVSSGTATITNAATTKLFASFAGSGATGNGSATLSCSPSCNATLAATTIANGGNVTVTGSTSGALVYTLTVTPSSGTPVATSTVTVNVVPAATAASLTAATSVIHQGSFTTLTPVFSFGSSPAVLGTATITGTDGSTYANFASNSSVTVAPNSTTTYTLNVVNGAGTAAAAPPPAVVTVAPGTWAALNDTSIDVRRGATVTALDNGKVLVAGGLDNTGTPLASARLCDATGDCGPNPPKVMTARAFHTATKITAGSNLGKVLLTGGYSATGPVDTADFYDPATDSFSATLPITTSTVTDKRARHVAVLLSDGSTVLIMGGTDGVPQDLDTAIKFDTSTPATANVSNKMGQKRANFTGTLLASNSVLIVGGKAGNLTAELFNPSGSGTFSNTGALPSGEDKRSHTAVLITAPGLNTGKILISGGLIGSGTPSGTQFLFSGSTFSPAPPLATFRGNHAAASLLSGVILLCGGTSDGSNTLQSCERYDPSSGTGTVSPTAPMISARKDFGLAPMTVSSVVEIFTAGGTSSAPMDFAETYSPN